MQNIWTILCSQNNPILIRNFSRYDSSPESQLEFAVATRWWRIVKYYFRWANGLHKINPRKNRKNHDLQCDSTLVVDRHVVAPDQPTHQTQNQYENEQLDDRLLALIVDSVLVSTQKLN